MKKNIIKTLAVVMVLLVSSCSLDPVVADNDTTDVLNEGTMRNMLDGAYNTMVDYRYWGRNMIIAGEVRSDNTFSNSNSNRFPAMSRMDLRPTTGDVIDIFQYAYASVSNPNILINTDIAEIEGEEANKNYMMGEAYAIRAIVHFDLLRLFGQQYIDKGSNLGVSYITEFKGDVAIPRGTVEENKTNIYADIDQAIQYMTQGEDSEFNTGKTTFNKDAAYALKARVATYFKDYDVIMSMSNEIERLIETYPVTPADGVVEYWAQSTPGAASIFELFENTSTNNTSINGLAYIYRGSSYGDIEAFGNLLEDADLGDTDVRASKDMIDYEGNKLRNMGKYPSMGTALGSDNIKIFRIEEVILNYAEALLETGNSGDALTYLNMIPENRFIAPEDNPSASNDLLYTSATMDNILSERRKEFLFEGFRFHDLARTGKDIRDMGEPQNNHGLVPAGDSRFAMPIPRRELDANPATEPNPDY